MKKKSKKDLICLVDNCPFRKQVEEETSCELKGQLSLFGEQELNGLDWNENCQKGENNEVRRTCRT